MMNVNTDSPHLLKYGKICIQNTDNLAYMPLIIKLQVQVSGAFDLPLISCIRSGSSEFNNPADLYGIDTEKKPIDKVLNMPSIHKYSPKY